MNRFLLTLLLLFTPAWFLQAERILLETESFQIMEDGNSILNSSAKWVPPIFWLMVWEHPFKMQPLQLKLKKVEVINYLPNQGLGSPLGSKGTTRSLSNHYQWNSRQKQPLVQREPSGIGKVEDRFLLKKGKNTLALRDLTGFNGRCDAIYLTSYKEVPPNDSEILANWRRDLLGITEKPIEKNMIWS